MSKVEKVHVLNESGGVAASSFVFDIDKTDEGDKLDLIAEGFEMYDAIYTEAVDAVIYGEVSITESVDSIKQSAKKAWDKLVAWFKDLVTAIKKKIRGQFDNMSVEVTRKEDETKITFFKDVVGTIKTFTLDDDEKYEFIDLGQTLKALTAFNTSIGQFKIKAGDDSKKAKDTLRKTTAVDTSYEKDEDITDKTTKFTDSEGKFANDLEDLVWSRSNYYINIKSSNESAIKTWAVGYAKNYTRIISQIYSTSDKIDKKFKGKQGNRQAYATVKAYRGVVNKLVRLNNAVVKVGDE